MKSTTWSAFETAWKWGSFVAAHAMVAVLLIGVITLFQWLLLSLGDPKLFDIVPFRYLFDGMDVAIFLAFLVFGTREAAKVFGGWR